MFGKSAEAVHQRGFADRLPQRHPDLELRSWRGIAQESLDSATCLHDAADVNLFAIDVSEMSDWVSFAVDFDNGHLYNKIDVVVFRGVPFNEPDVVLPAEALAELREAIDRYQVLDWPSRDPGEITYVGEYVNPNKFELAVVFSDDTGSFADQQTASDPDMVGFLKFAQTFLAEHVE